MKILYVGLLYNYGKPDEGFSYEHMNIEAGLLDCASKGIFEVDCWYPDLPHAVFTNGEFSYFSQGEHLAIELYDAIFHVAFNNSLDLPMNMVNAAKHKNIPIIQFDCDSSWRFKDWILPRKDRVTHFITTHSMTIPWYEQNGMKVIKSQWAGSPLYKSNRELYKYDVSFVGQKHGQMPNGRFVRSEIINDLVNAGIKVDLFGNYWDGHPNWHGYLTKFEDVINTFNVSRINLNLSNPWHFNTMSQIKGRHFEIPQCQGFQISTPADDLSSYFIEDEEIIIARSSEDLIDKVKYYIHNSDEREKIAKAGHNRMLKDHQWSNRFDHIFREVGII